MSAGQGLGWGSAWVLEVWAHCLLAGPPHSPVPGPANTLPSRGLPCALHLPNLHSPRPFLTPSSGYTAPPHPPEPSSWGPEGLTGSYLRSHSFSGLQARLHPCFLQPGSTGSSSARSHCLALLPSQPHPFCPPRAQPHPTQSPAPGTGFLLLNLHFMGLWGLWL